MSEENARATAESVCGAFRTRFHAAWKSHAPPEKIECHFREARKQMLMGLRELIDDRIQKMSQTDARARACRSIRSPRENLPETAANAYPVHARIGSRLRFESCPPASAA